MKRSRSQRPSPQEGPSPPEAPSTGSTPPQRQSPWTGPVTPTTTARPTLMYRVAGGRARREGKWLTLDRPASAAAARQELALPPDNAATEIVEVWVPAGTRIQIGEVAPNFGQPGGGVQVELLEFIPRVCYTDPQPLLP
jgi:hypothetical protein